MTTTDPIMRAVAEAASAILAEADTHQMGGQTYHIHSNPEHSAHHLENLSKEHRLIDYHTAAHAHAVKHLGADHPIAVKHKIEIDNSVASATWHHKAAKNTGASDEQIFSAARASTQ